MNIILVIVMFSVGILLIVKGGDVFIEAAGWTSDVTGISRVVIGATLVSFATTSPEYFVSLIAVMKGFNDLSVGNAVGSLICNIGIAFALLSICLPDKVDDRLFWLKGAIMLVSTALLWLFCFDGELLAAEGVNLLLIFVFFTFINIRYAKDGVAKKRRLQTNPLDIAINIAKFVGGAAAVIFGSNIIVDNGQIIASYLGVSEAVIGLTVIAIGTSLPEIVTSIAAIIKKENSLSIGNVIGANVLDATLILASSSFISGGSLTVSQETVSIDLPVTLLLMVIAVLPTTIGKKVYRWQGALLMVVYAMYLLHIVL